MSEQLSGLKLVLGWGAVDQAPEGAVAILYAINDSGPQR